jgi:SAM-dependent methyltransferase
MSWITSFILSVTIPPSLKPFYSKFKSSPIRLLDVGCGPYSPSKTKKHFPCCEYHGVDLNDKSLDDENRDFVTRFYSLNLDNDPLDDIPDEYFDVIVMSHIIEHLHFGLEVLARLTQKLRPGGFVYIEFPGVRSLNMPTARSGFLHFHDDPTHVRLYTIPEIVNTLLANKCSIIRAGIRRDRARLLMTPFLFARGLLLHGDPWSGRLWDAFGIAEFVYARKAG